MSKARIIAKNNVKSILIERNVLSKLKSNFIVNMH